jgi:chemotaxis protein methyltransferase CheR
VLSRLRVRAAVRERAEFRRLNLMELPETGQPSGLDIIFFRNVLIYFNRETTRRIIRAMHHRLAPGGFLFLGPSETLWDISSDFDCLMFENSYLYRKKPAVAGPAAGPPVIPAFVAPLPVPPPPARPGADAPPPSKARVLLEEAELMVDLGDYDRAQGLVDEVLFLEPDSRSAMMLKLTLLANLNRGRELLRAAERFVQRVPIFPELHYLLGRFHESQKRVPEAMQEYRRVLFIGADYLQARDRLLRLLVAAGETDNARREARNIYDQLLTGRFRSFPPGVAEPLNSAEQKKRCLSISEP